MSQSEAQKSLFTLIQKTTEESERVENLGRRSEILANLALAFRYAAGGQQPGSVHVEK